MAASQLTCDEIRSYLVSKGGKVSNRDALRHFKRYLTDPATQESARFLFKYYINKLVTIHTENNEKCLILRPKYFNSLTDLPPPPPQGHPQPPPVVLSPFPSNMSQYQQQPDPINSVGIPLAASAQGLFHKSPAQSPSSQSPIRAPPPYRAPPPFTPSPGRASPGGISLSSNLSLQDSVVSLECASQVSFHETPKVPPRRRSADKMSLQSIPSTPIDIIIPKENRKPIHSDAEEQVDKETVSVKERTQKFNRLASVDDELNSSSPKKTPLKTNEKGAEDHDDGVSVTSLEPKKCREWYVTAAKADYIALSKLALEEPLLVKVKDPFSAYTVLHWAAKHGNCDIIKQFAGNYKANVNARTNGGYTPLHLAAQYGHDEVFELLIKVYKADFNIADFSGRTPEKYRLFTESSHNPKTTQKFKGRKKQSDKDRFLRIGSLNVRVKKTTEAFSNFLGVGGSATISHIDPISEKVHKGWGSADNVQKDNTMPAPKTSSTKRKYKRIDSTPIRTNSNPGTPQQPPRSRQHQRHSLQDSDSDTAAGFDSQWH